MLHAAEGPRDLPDALCRRASVRHGNGGHVVRDVVHAGQADVRAGHDRSPALSGEFGKDGLPLEPHAAVPRPQHGVGDRGEREPRHGGRHGQRFPERAGDAVVIVQHGAAGTSEDFRLRFDVFLHRGVPVEVVRRDVGDRGDVDRGVDRHELEGGQLRRDGIVRGDERQPVEQRFPDVPAEDDLPLRHEEQGRQRRRGCLAVAAGDRVNRAGMRREKAFHLGRDDRTPRARLVQFGQIGPDAGGAEDEVLVDVPEIAVPGDELRAECFEPDGVFPELRGRLFVADGEEGGVFRGDFRQGHMGDARPEQGHAAAAEEFLEIHGLPRCKEMAVPRGEFPPDRLSRYSYYIPSDGIWQEKSSRLPARLPPFSVFSFFSLFSRPFLRIFRGDSVDKAGPLCYNYFVCSRAVRSGRDASSTISFT